MSRPAEASSTISTRKPAAFRSRAAKKQQMFVAMQHTAKGSSKIVKKCRLPVTSLRTVDMVVTEMAVITFPGGHATLVETAPGVSKDQVVSATEAELTIPDKVPVMAL